MKKLAEMAYWNGLVVGANFTAAGYNLLGAIGQAEAGNPLGTAIGLVVTFLLGYMGWRTYRRHKAGLGDLPE